MEDFFNKKSSPSYFYSSSPWKNFNLIPNDVLFFSQIWNTRSSRGPQCFLKLANVESVKDGRQYLLVSLLPTPTKEKEKIASLSSSIFSVLVAYSCWLFAKQNKSSLPNLSDWNNWRLHGAPVPFLLLALQKQWQPMELNK